MTEAMRFLRVNISGHVSMNTTLEPGRVHIEISDSAGSPGLRWFITPCDTPRLQECINAAVQHYQADTGSPPSPEPPAAASEPPPEGEAPTAPIASISNANPALLTLAEADHAKFAALGEVTIAGNSIAAANGIVTLSAPDSVAFTYDIGLDLSLEVAPGTGGTVTGTAAARGAKRGRGSKRAA